MRAIVVLDKLKVGDNTLIAINDHCEDIKNGTGVLDDKGNLRIILSVGMSNGISEITNLLIEGEFDSKKIYV